MVYAFWWPRSLCNICFDHTPHSLMLHWFRGWKGENAIDYGEQNTREPRVMDLWENKVRRMFCEQHKQQGSARCLKCGAWIVSKHCQAGVELDIYIRRAGRVFKKSICELWLLLGLGCLPRFIEIIEYSFDLPCFDWQLWTTQVQEDIFCLTKSPDFPMPKWVSAPVDDILVFGFNILCGTKNQKQKRSVAWTLQCQIWSWRFLVWEVSGHGCNDMHDSVVWMDRNFSGNRLQFHLKLRRYCIPDRGNKLWTVQDTFCEAWLVQGWGTLELFVVWFWSHKKLPSSSTAYAFSLGKCLFWSGFFSRLWAVGDETRCLAKEHVPWSHRSHCARSLQ